MIFKYVAYTTTGDKVADLVEAESEERAEAFLWQKNLSVITLKKHKPRTSLDEAFPSLFGVKSADVVNFSQQLSILLSSGIGLLPALQIISDQTTKPSFKKIIAKLTNDLRSGMPFSEAAAKYPQVFPTIFLRLVQIAEQTGNMPQMLAEVAEFLDKQVQAMRKIRRALVYPMAVLLLAGVAVTILLTFVLPALTNLFSEFGGTLPLITRILLTTASILKADIVFIIMGVIAIAGAGWLYIRKPKGALNRDRLLLKVPFLGSFLLHSDLARIMRAISILLSAGIPITEALNLVTTTPQNRVLQRAMQTTREDVIQGSSISKAFESNPFFPRLVSQMVAVGEETGNLKENLQRLSDYYEENSDRAMSAMTGVIEPALILGVGAFVGFIAVSIIFPMYNLIHQIRPT